METDTYRRNITAAQKSKRSSQILFSAFKYQTRPQKCLKTENFELLNYSI